MTGEELMSEGNQSGKEAAAQLASESTEQHVLEHVTHQVAQPDAVEQIVPSAVRTGTSEQKDTSAADAAQQPAQPAVTTAAQTIVPPAPEQRAAGPIKRRPAQLAADLRGST